MRLHLRRVWAATLSVALSAACGSGGPVEPESFASRPVFGNWLLSVTPNRGSFGFYLYLPEGYDTSTGETPLLVYLQGWGNFGAEPNPGLCSSGPLKPLYVSDTALDPGGRDRLEPHVRAAMVVAPRLPYYDPYYHDPLGYYDPDTLHKVVAWVRANYRVDAKRVYITGLSEGGGGTWAYAWRHPEVVAAILPVSSGLAYPVNDGLKSMPIWMLQSVDDPAVLHQTGSDASFASVTGVSNVFASWPGGGDYTISYSHDTGLGPWRLGVVPPSGLVTYTLYGAGGHDAWTRTYASPEVWTWLFAQSR
jgi:predicted peptidase